MMKMSAEPHPDPKRLNLLKCIYFLGGLSGATWGRFSTIYFNQILHLTVQQIGFIEMVMPVVRLLTTPLWGVLADRCHAKKTVSGIFGLYDSNSNNLRM
jgi:MFS-type transporter involved in bile tolerance (Atg22 family)